MIQPSAFVSDLSLLHPSAERPKPHVLPAHQRKEYTSPAALTFSLLTERTQFDALEDEWCALFARAGTGTQVFQNFHWLWHWCNHFLDGQGKRTELAIVTGRKNGKLVLIWPLARQRLGGLTQLCWMGRPVSQYGDVLMDPDACRADDLKKSWQFLTTAISADTVVLRKVRADAAAAPLLEAMCETPLLHQTAPYLDLTAAASFEDYQKRYSGKARRNRRRLRRRVEEHAPLTIATHDAGPTRTTLAGKAVSLKRNWLKARGLLSAAIQDDRTHRFFRDVAHSNRHPTGCRTTSLEIGNQTAAIEVSFVAKRHCAVHVIVYHTDFEKAGAGVLLMEDAIRSAIDTGVHTFDLMAPGDSYKLDWADGVVDVYDWTTPLSPLGHVYALLRLNKVPAFLKNKIQTLPLRARQILHGGFAHTR